MINFPMEKKAALLVNKLKNNKAFYYALYSALFVFVAAGVFLALFTSGKTLIYNGDASTQHYPALAYWGEYLRNLLGCVFSGQGVPIYDYNIGFGADILTTLHYYAIGDPLNLLAVFFPMDKTEILYVGLIILRFWLAGVAFLAYCKKINLSKYASLCGVFIYLFCAYSFANGVNHPFFLNPLIYFPIILIGMEKIFRKERPYLFIAFIAISAISNFYLFYAISIMMFIYAIVRVFYYVSAKQVGKIFACAGKFVLFFTIGVLIAAPIFIPNVMALFETTRSSSNLSINPLYPMGYYKGLLGSFVGTGGEILNFTPIAMLAMLLLFIQRKKNTTLKIFFVIGFAFLLSPIFGSALNGFSYPSNRWVWSFGFLVAIIFAKLLPSLLAISKKELALLCLATVGFTGVALVLSGRRNVAVVPGLILMLVALAVFVMNFLYKDERFFGKKITGVAAKVGVFLLITVGLFAHGRDIYLAADGNNYNRLIKPKGIIAGQFEQAASSAAAKIEDESFWRFSSNEKNLWFNSAMLHKTKGNRLYFSMISPSITNFFIRDNGIETHFNDFSVAGVQERTYLEAVLSTKYFLKESGKNMPIPYGFEISHSVKAGEKEFEVYENKYALPFGYVYNSAMEYKDFEKLPLEKRQQVYTKAAVVNKVGGSLKSKKLEFTEKDISYEIENNKNVELKNGKFYVKKNNSNVKIKFKGLPLSETYLIFNELYHRAASPEELYSTESLSTMSSKKKDTLYAQYNEAKTNIAPTLTASYGVSKKKIWLITKENQWYHGNQSFFSNLGYSAQAKNEITLNFEIMGEYSFNSMKVVCQDMGAYKKEIEKLKGSSMENTVFGTNSFSGSVSLENEGVLSLSIPYQKGWKAYVNGKEQELLQVNTIFSGVNLSPGKNEVLLRYETPGLKVGLIMCAIGVLCFAFLGIYLKLLKKKLKNCCTVLC